jgi:hypothetical protein
VKDRVSLGRPVAQKSLLALPWLYLPGEGTRAPYSRRGSGRLSRPICRAQIRFGEGIKIEEIEGEGEDEFEFDGEGIKGVRSESRGGKGSVQSVADNRGGVYFSLLRHLNS